ncbi:hypothetical protein C8Q80DRAFT_519419 [Daedaleopsis nitida]|nr:hypothetical protein C8Q80DRAFT_519419 [Daedaleopsis nitida]
MIHLRQSVRQRPHTHTHDSRIAYLRHPSPVIVTPLRAPRAAYLKLLPSMPASVIRRFHCRTIAQGLAPHFPGHRTVRGQAAPGARRPFVRTTVDSRRMPEPRTRSVVSHPSRPDPPDRLRRARENVNQVLTKWRHRPSSSQSQSCLSLSLSLGFGRCWSTSARCSLVRRMLGGRCGTDLVFDRARTHLLWTIITIGAARRKVPAS